jgi:hypothetical protein
MLTGPVSGALRESAKANGWNKKKASAIDAISTPMLGPASTGGSLYIAHNLVNMFEPPDFKAEFAPATISVE